uniref:Putative secreted protein n=1 Tax=Rhipicephalus microplus TaxID=6941 RepID=A0A6M2DDQ8_RHIMP
MCCHWLCCICITMMMTVRVSVCLSPANNSHCCIPLVLKNDFQYFCLAGKWHTAAVCVYVTLLLQELLKVRNLGRVCKG